MLMIIMLIPLHNDRPHGKRGISGPVAVPECQPLPRNHSASEWMPVLDVDLRILMRMITRMVMRMLMMTMEMIKMWGSLILMMMMPGGGDEGKRNLPKMKIIGRMRTILVGITPTWEILKSVTKSPIEQESAIWWWPYGAECATSQMVGGPSPKRGGCHEALLGVYMYQVPRPKCSAHVTEVVYQGTQKSDRYIHLNMTGQDVDGWTCRNIFLFLNAVLWVTKLRICFGRRQICRDRY